MSESVKQENNRTKWLWKPGQSGNPKGRPPGQTLKEYIRERFRKMSEAERIEYLNQLSPEIQWRMAEGNPADESKIEHTGEIVSQTPIPEAAMKIIKADLKKKKTGNDL